MDLRKEAGAEACAQWPGGTVKGKAIEEAEGRPTGPGNHSEEVGIHFQCYGKLLDGFDQEHDMVMFRYTNH